MEGKHGVSLVANEGNSGGLIVSDDFDDGYQPMHVFSVQSRVNNGLWRCYLMVVDTN